MALAPFRVRDQAATSTQPQGKRPEGACPLPSSGQIVWNQIRQREPVELVQAVDGMDSVDRMDTTSQVGLRRVHIVHKVHAVHHFEKRLQS